LHRQLIRSFVTIAALLPLFGCGKIIGSGGPNADLGQSALPPVAFGYAVADEPQAALIGRQILNAGGRADCHPGRDLAAAAPASSKCRTAKARFNPR
jgi:hypothetical protein